MSPRHTPFQTLRLSAEERQHCQDRSFQLLDRTLRSYDERDGQGDDSRRATPLHHSNLENTRWKLLKTQADASLYTARHNCTLDDHNLLGGGWKDPVVVLTGKDGAVHQAARGLRHPGGPVRSDRGRPVPTRWDPVDGVQARLASQDDGASSRLRDAGVHGDHDASKRRLHRLRDGAAGEALAVSAATRGDRAQQSHVRRHLQAARAWRSGRLHSHVCRVAGRDPGQTDRVDHAEGELGLLERGEARRDEEAAVVHRQPQVGTHEGAAASVVVTSGRLQALPRQAGVDEAVRSGRQERLRLVRVADMLGVPRRAETQSAGREHRETVGQARSGVPLVLGVRAAASTQRYRSSQPQGAATAAATSVDLIDLSLRSPFEWRNLLRFPALAVLRYRRPCLKSLSIVALKLAGSLVERQSCICPISVIDLVPSRMKLSLHLLVALAFSCLLGIGDAATSLTCGSQLKDIYYHGFNLQTSTVTDAAACCSLCAAYDGCVLYTYFHSSSTGQSLCYLKSGAGEKTNYADSSSVTAVSAFMVSVTSAPGPTATSSPSPAPTTATPSACSAQLDGVFYDDFTIYEFSTDSADECCAYCAQLAAEGCVLYTLYVSKSEGIKRCLLKSAMGSSTTYTTSTDLTVPSARSPRVSTVATRRAPPAASRAATASPGTRTTTSASACPTAAEDSRRTWTTTATT
ncbi:hypothetical protein ON010_g15678 [Phytophthora cinnamomi]|nr:hypothetical protein ON010_g15678 [Phytophthora cinnamomi]